MGSNIDEIRKLEEQMIQAELGPDPDYFARVLDDNALLDGKKLKAFVVEMHTPGKGQKFTKVQMSDVEYIDHGTAVVVSCLGRYEGPSVDVTMKFVRVWLKKSEGWKIVAATVEAMK
jgi:hypothetical protein